MSEHKTGSTFDKEVYRQRRKDGLPGSERAALKRPVDLSKQVNEKTGEPKYLTHFGPSRRQRRQRVIGRGATKKGNVPLIHIDENRHAHREFVRQGSKQYNLAMHNSRRMQKASARGE